MAPTLSGSALEKRQYCGSGWYWDSYNQGCYHSGTWNNWGRWVALVVIIVFFLFIGFLFFCVQSRRRRRAGLAPAYGTGWLAGKPSAYQTNGYSASQPQYQGQYGAPAPPYSPPAQQQQHQQYTGNTFNQNDGYYGQQSGIELQQPQHAYQPPRAGGEDVYEPPTGPPPGKGDGIIR